MLTHYCVMTIKSKLRITDLLFLSEMHIQAYPWSPQLLNIHVHHSHKQVQEQFKRSRPCLCHLLHWPDFWVLSKISALLFSGFFWFHKSKSLQESRGWIIHYITKSDTQQIPLPTQQWIETGHIEVKAQYSIIIK